MKNLLIILFVFLIPIGIYAYFETTNPVSNPTYANGTATLYKFTSPMCSECKEVAKMLEGLPQKYPDVNFVEINVSNGNYKRGATKKLIDKYGITTVPTVVFVDKNDKLINKYEVEMTKEEIIKNLDILSGGK